jgi:hypothetical protein
MINIRIVTFIIKDSMLEMHQVCFHILSKPTYHLLRYPTQMSYPLHSSPVTIMQAKNNSRRKNTMVAEAAIVEHTETANLPAHV